MPTLVRALTVGGAGHAVRIRVLPATGRPGAEASAAASGIGAFALEVEWQGATHRLRCDPRPEAKPGDGRLAPTGLADERFALSGLADERFALDIEDVRLEATVYAEGAERWITVRGVHVFATSRDPADEQGAGGVPDAERLQAPLPGKVIHVAVQAGQSVAAGTVLLVLEAMKVEHQITAPHAGRVKALRFKSGDRVQRGDLLVELE